MIDERDCLVLQTLNPVIDLLQCTHCRQCVLDVIGWIENSPLRMSGNACARDGQSDDTGSKYRAKAASDPARAPLVVTERANAAPTIERNMGILIVSSNSCRAIGSYPIYGPGSRSDWIDRGVR